jgi:hypothetical protein
MQIVEIPQYIRKVELSKARQVKYYELGKKMPKAKKYTDTKKYEYQQIPGFGLRKFLIDLQTKQRVIANPLAAGTARNVVINGQKIYNGEINQHTRNKVLSTIKASFIPYINKLEQITKFPITIRCEIHDVIRESSGNSLWDIDNRSYPYIKAFQDCLTGNKGRDCILKCKQVIPDDNILYITQAPVPKFIPVDKEEDRKLIFYIEEEIDERILNHVGFMEELQKLKLNLDADFK